MSTIHIAITSFPQKSDKIIGLLRAGNEVVLTHKGQIIFEVTLYNKKLKEPEQKNKNTKKSLELNTTITASPDDNNGDESATGSTTPFDPFGEPGFEAMDPELDAEVARFMAKTKSG